MTTHIALKKASRIATPLHLVTGKKFEVKSFSQAHQNWIKAQEFEAKAGQLICLPDEKKGIHSVLYGLDDIKDTKTPYEFMWSLGSLPLKLPAGDYALHTDLSEAITEQLCLGWALGAYQFTDFKKKAPLKTFLIPPKNCDYAKIKHMAESIFLTRDLINRPANDLTPLALAHEAQNLAKTHKAKFSKILGKDLLKKNFPAIYEVGKAAEAPPCFIELNWGKKSNPHLILVGKGITFDTGGLDIKPASNMILMKKDMGGAAHVLGIAHMIMSEKLPIQLTVLIPSAENAIAGNAFRPSDIIQTRKGLSVEIGNTDAEGRLILADALTYACEKKPDLVIDMATLTGAARIAMGLEIPAFFANNEKLATHLSKASEKSKDPVWRLPLWEGYRKENENANADLSNIGSSSYGGAITAALFLERFLDSDKTSWAHFDMMAWNPSPKAGRPVGGEAMGLRAVYEMIESFQNIL